MPTKLSMLTFFYYCFSIFIHNYGSLYDDAQQYTQETRSCFKHNHEIILHLILKVLFPPLRSDVGREMLREFHFARNKSTKSVPSTAPSVKSERGDFERLHRWRDFTRRFISDKLRRRQRTCSLLSSPLLYSTLLYSTSSQ